MIMVLDASSVTAHNISVACCHSIVGFCAHQIEEGSGDGQGSNSADIEELVAEVARLQDEKQR